MSRISRFRWRMVAILALTLAIVFTLSTSLLASAAGTLTQISSDPYHNKTSQHLTELEPDTVATGKPGAASGECSAPYGAGAAGHVEGRSSYGLEGAARLGLAKST